jgi:fused signal recognition particle receptor
MEEITKYITTLAQQLGADDPAVVLVLAILAFVFLSLIVFALRTTIQRNQESDRTAAILARVEQLERNLSEFRADMLKSVQHFRGLTDDVKDEIVRARKRAEDGRGGNEGGSGAGGSGSSGPASGGSTPSGQGGGGRGASGVEIQSSAANINLGMQKTRTTLLSRFKALFSSKASIKLEALGDLEELLISSDVGVRCATAIVEQVRAIAQTSEGVGENRLQELVREEVRRSLVSVPTDHPIYSAAGSPLIVLVVGVNGVGKTTTTAKLAARWKNAGKRVVLVAADTFRAAAVQQLLEWGKRLDVLVVSGAEGAKPSTVVFDGMVAAKEKGADVIVIDTAGRLHTKSNLMQELEGIRNAIGKHYPKGPDQTILVLDGVSGQNALAQAREFNSAVALTGVVVTKLDGTPKGGIVVAISRELNLPVLYVGVGERAEDLLPFSVDHFVESLFSDSGSSAGVSSMMRVAGSEVAERSPALSGALLH